MIAFELYCLARTQKVQKRVVNAACVRNACDAYSIRRKSVTQTGLRIVRTLVDIRRYFVYLETSRYFLYVAAIRTLTNKVGYFGRSVNFCGKITRPMRQSRDMVAVLVR